MKNKKEEQIAAKKKHRAALKRKNRRKEIVLERNKPSKTERPTILIVCEGENTEPSYFRQFKLSTATIKTIGEGYNTVSLVNRSIQIANKKQYDKVWCVFDKDDFPANDFNNAIQLAKSNNFGVAYSNQAFEYWIILHLQDHQGGGMHRDNYNKKINDLLKPFGLTYDGNGSKIITEEIFDVLDSYDDIFNKKRKTLAIERAKRNIKNHNKNNASIKESSTTVYELVEELTKYI